MLDDVEDFARLRNALKAIDLNEELLDDLFKALGGILHLGNVEFVENLSDSKGIFNNM